MKLRVLPRRRRSNDVVATTKAIASLSSDIDVCSSADHEHSMHIDGSARDWNTSYCSTGSHHIHYVPNRPYSSDLFSLRDCQFAPTGTHRPFLLLDHGFDKLTDVVRRVKTAVEGDFVLAEPTADR